MAGRISGQRPWRRVRRVVTGSAPAAGADWSFTVPGDKLWQLVSLYARLVTDANAATRSVDLLATDGDVTYLVLPPSGTQAASLTRDYAWGPHLGASAVGTGISTPTPRLTLQPGWTLAASTGSVQVGDQWAAPQLLVVETTVQRGRVELGDVPDLTVEVIATSGG